MASSDASQLAGALEIRLARDGRPYTRRMFTEWYGNAAERRWADAAALPLPSDWLAAGTTTGNAAQLSGNITRALPLMPPPERMHQIVAAEEAARGGDAAQLPAGITRAQPPIPSLVHGGDAAQRPAAQLMPEHVIAIRQQEAARGPPRSLHRLARDALNNISNEPTLNTVNLDDWFPWVQYVAAHRQSAAIIGPGITHANGVFFPGTRDSNRGGAPRLDFCFTRTDGTVCRVHPGKRSNLDAQLKFAHDLR
jgi:hypothetical protein